MTGCGCCAHCRCTGRCMADYEDDGKALPPIRRVVSPPRAATPSLEQQQQANIAGVTFVTDSHKKLKNALENLPHPNDLIYSRKTAKAMPLINSEAITPLQPSFAHHAVDHKLNVDSLHPFRRPGVDSLTSSRAPSRAESSVDEGSVLSRTSSKASVPSKKSKRNGIEEEEEEEEEDSDEEGAKAAHKSATHGKHGKQGKSHHPKSANLTVDTEENKTTGKKSKSKKSGKSPGHASEQHAQTLIAAKVDYGMFTPTPTLGTFNKPQTRKIASDSEEDEEEEGHGKGKKQHDPSGKSKRHHNRDIDSDEGSDEGGEEEDKEEAARLENERKAKAKDERERQRQKEERRAAKEERRQREKEAEEKEQQQRQKEERRKREKIDKRKLEREEERRRKKEEARAVEAKRKEAEMAEQQKRSETDTSDDDSDDQSSSSSSEEAKTKKARKSKSKVKAKHSKKDDDDSSDEDVDEDGDGGRHEVEARPVRRFVAGGSIDAASFATFEPATAAPQLAARTVKAATVKPESKRERLKLHLAEKLGESLDKYVEKSASQRTIRSQSGSARTSPTHQTVPQHVPVALPSTTTIVPSSINAIAKLVVRNATSQANTIHFLDMSRFDDTGGPLIAFRLEATSTDGMGVGVGHAGGGGGHRDKHARDWLHDSLHNGVKVQGNVRLGVGRDGPPLFDVIVKRRTVDRFTIQGIAGVENGSHLAKFTDAPHWSDHEDYRHLFCRSPAGHALKWFVDEPDRLMRMMGRNDNDYGHVYVEARSTVAVGGGGHVRRRAPTLKETTLIFLPGATEPSAKAEKTRFIENGFACVSWWCARQTFDEGQVAAAHAEVEMIENIEKAFEVDLLAGA